MFDSPLLRLPPAGEHDTFEVRDPATGELLATLPRMSGTEAAAACFLASHAGPLEDRPGTLLRIAAAHRDNREALAQIVTRENGKPLAQARAEVDYAAGFYEHAATVELAPRRVRGDPHGLSWTVHPRPAGVAALITPWNFPVAMVAKKLSAALAAGCACVWKPSELTPLSALAIAGLLDFLPTGTLSVVFGDAQAIGRALCEHPAVRIVSFTGSTAVGRLLGAQAGAHGKRTSLELGGNAPFLVFGDADLDLAADALVLNKTRCSGQTCVCANRVLVDRSVAPAFAAKLAERLGRLVVGPGGAEGVDLGPLIGRSGFDKVRAHIADAVERGARIVLGAVPRAPRAEFGFFVQPTVLADVPDDARCLREETFGPVVPIRAFDSEVAAVAEANAVDAGLAAYVFTADPAIAARIAAALRFGHVAVNSGSGPTPEAPFGGMRGSGYGREGGDEGVHEYVEWQTIATRR